MIKHIGVIAGLTIGMVFAGLACDDAPTKPKGDGSAGTAQFIGTQWPHQTNGTYFPIELPLKLGAFGRTTYGGGAIYEGFGVGVFSTEPQSCSNIELPGNVTVRSNHITIDLDGLFAPAICTDGYGPAYSGYLFDADTGTYLITITYRMHRADFKIILRERQLEFSGYSSWIQRDGVD